MNTFCQLWGEITPAEVKQKINQEIARLNISKITNLEEQAIAMVGTTLYNKLIKGYTEKQWGYKCAELPPSIIKRLPLRFTYNNNYFNDSFQGVPIVGYTPIINKMLKNADIRLGVEFKDFIKTNPTIANKIIYTGAIDDYYDYCYGELEYRSLKFDHKKIASPNFQNNAVVNYTDSYTPYTRIIEHKHFNFGQPETNYTIISYEYPTEWTKSKERYYPINNDSNSQLYKLYETKANKEPNVVFGGRLGTYKYLDMDKTIIAALELCAREFD